MSIILNLKIIFVIFPINKINDLDLYLTENYNNNLDRYIGMSINYIKMYYIVIEFY